MALIKFQGGQRGGTTPPTLARRTAGGEIGNRGRLLKNRRKRRLGSGGGAGDSGGAEFDARFRADEIKFKAKNAAKEAAKARRSELLRSTLGGALAANRNPDIGKISGELDAAMGAGGGAAGAGRRTGIGANALALNERIRAAAKSRSAAGAIANRKRTIEDQKRSRKALLSGIDVPSIGTQFGPERLPPTAFRPGNFTDDQGNIIGFKGTVATPQQQDLTGRVLQAGADESRRASRVVGQESLRRLTRDHAETQAALSSLQGERQQALGKIPGGREIAGGPQGVQDQLGPTVQRMADQGRQLSGATTGFTAGEGAMQDRLAALEAQISPELGRIQSLFGPAPPIDPNRLPLVVPRAGGGQPGQAPAPAQPGAAVGGPMNFVLGPNGEPQLGGTASPVNDRFLPQGGTAAPVSGPFLPPSPGVGHPTTGPAGPSTVPPQPQPQSAPFGVGSRLDPRAGAQPEPQGGQLTAGQQTFGRPGERVGTVATPELIRAEQVDRERAGQVARGEATPTDPTFVPQGAAPAVQRGPVAPPQPAVERAPFTREVQPLAGQPAGTAVPVSGPFLPPPPQPVIPPGAHPGDVGNLNFQGGAFGGGFAGGGGTPAPAPAPAPQPGIPPVTPPQIQPQAAAPAGQPGQDHPLNPTERQLRSIEDTLARLTAAIQPQGQVPAGGAAPTPAVPGAAPPAGAPPTPAAPSGSFGPRILTPEQKSRQELIQAQIAELKRKGKQETEASGVALPKVNVDVKANLVSRANGLAEFEPETTLGLLGGAIKGMATLRSPVAGARDVTTKSRALSKRIITGMESIMDDARKTGDKDIVDAAATAIRESPAFKSASGAIRAILEDELLRATPTKK